MSELIESILTSSTVDKYHIDEQLTIRRELNKLTDFELTLEHVMTIVASWHFYQVMINVSNSIKLPQIKRKVRRLVKLKNEILHDISDESLATFSQSGIISSLFSSNSHWEQFETILNRKRGSLFSKDVLIKRAYFELLFIAESIGLTLPEKNYQKSDLKTFLQIVTKPFFNNEESLEHYCQEYNTAKKHPKVDYKIISLIKKCVQYRTDVYMWQVLLTLYQTKISSSMLFK